MKWFKLDAETWQLPEVGGVKHLSKRNKAMPRSMPLGWYFALYSDPHHAIGPYASAAGAKRACIREASTAKTRMKEIERMIEALDRDMLRHAELAAMPVAGRA